MADFNALEALINANIKKNGVQAITGNILNGILRGMVSALGKGYTIAGSVTPSSDPGTMTGPVAYIAYTAGTYTHFDGLEVEQGEVAMLIYNEAEWHKEVLYSLAATATVDGNVGTPEVGVSFVDGLLTFDFRNMKGEPGVNGQDGEAAGFGAVTASVDASVGTPSVTVSSSGPNTAKSFAFSFHNLKGEQGVQGIQGIQGPQGVQGEQGVQGPVGVESCIVTVDNTSGTPSCSVSLVGQVLHLDFTGLKGAQGDTGSSVDYPFTIVNNLTTNDATQALSAAMGVQLESEVSQLEAEMTGAVAQILTPTENTGKYIGYQGTLATGATFAYTNQFYVNAGETIRVIAQGYLTYVTMIAKVVTEGSAYTPLVMSTDSNVHTYEYTATESGYYAASYSTSESRTIAVYKNTPELLDRRIQSLETQSATNTTDISDLDLRATGAKYEKQTVTETTGKFVNNTGVVMSSSGFAYTSKFYVQKGQKIIVKAAGYLTSVAMIAKVVTEDSAYTPLVVSTDSNVHTYEYTATDDGYYAASYSTGTSHSVYVSQNTPEMLNERIAILEQADAPDNDKLEGITETTLTVEAEESGKFIAVATNAPSASASFSYSKPIFVKAGTLLLVTAKGYLTYVAMIAKVVYDGVKYVNVRSSADSTVMEYRYFVESDGYYAFSWVTADGIVAKAVKYPVIPNYRLQDNLYGGVPVVGMIGDSLMSGAGYDTRTSGVHDNIEYAWWKVLERKSGCTYRRFCVGGMSTRSFITNASYGLPVALTAGNYCNLYIIGLGVNDRAIGDSYLGTSSDIDTNDPDNNGDTYYGNYAKIIQKITAANPGCKFILFTDPRTDGDFNDAVREIAGMFSNCYLADLWAVYSPYFTTGGFFDKYKDSSAHYPAMAYSAMAKLLERAIDDCINDNRADFVGIQYSL